MLVLHRRPPRYLLVAFAVGFFALFSVLHGDVIAWLPDHWALGRIFFFEFALWPWLSVAWIGLAFGWDFAFQETPGRRARFLIRMTAAGLGPSPSSRSGTGRTGLRPISRWPSSATSS